MLAARRLSFLLALSPLCLIACLPLPLRAQSPYMDFHGVPASGIGGTSAAFSAVRPNANAYGGAAFGCCASFFFPSSFSPMVPYPSFGTDQRSHHGHRRHRHDGDVVVAEPVFIPLALPYAADPEDDADEPDEAGPARGEPTRAAQADTPSGSRAERRLATINGIPESEEQGAGGNAGEDLVASGDAGSAALASPAEVAPGPPEPVVAQPTTVLVFKDGHRSEVVNYAIVGDTLFDFSGERARKIAIADLDIAATQKVNDAAGVEFKLPSATAN